jgi:hypothetical protein
MSFANTVAQLEAARRQLRELEQQAQDKLYHDINIIFTAWTTKLEPFRQPYGKAKMGRYTLEIAGPVNGPTDDKFLGVRWIKLDNMQSYLASPVYGTPIIFLSDNLNDLLPDGGNHSIIKLTAYGMPITIKDANAAKMAITARKRVNELINKLQSKSKEWDKAENVTTREFAGIAVEDQYETIPYLEQQFAAQETLANAMERTLNTMIIESLELDTIKTTEETKKRKTKNNENK